MDIKVSALEIVKEFSVDVEIEGTVDSFIFKIKRNKDNSIEYFIDGCPFNPSSPFHQEFIENWPNSFLI